MTDQSLTSGCDKKRRVHIHQTITEELQNLQTSRDMSWNDLQVHCICQLSKPGSVPLNTGRSPVSKLLAKSNKYKSGIPPSDGGMEPSNLLFRDL